MHNRIIHKYRHTYIHVQTPFTNILFEDNGKRVRKRPKNTACDGAAPYFTSMYCHYLKVLLLGELHVGLEDLVEDGRLLVDQGLHLHRLLLLANLDRLHAENDETNNRSNRSNNIFINTGKIFSWLLQHQKRGALTEILFPCSHNC